MLFTPRYEQLITVITVSEVTVPQLLVMVYLIVSVPGDTPLTIPPETVALLLDTLHVPPGVASVRVIVLPTHTDKDVAATWLTTGMLLTVTVTVPVHPGMVQVITAVPTETPVTTPEEAPTVATPVPPLVHVPPAGVELRVMVQVPQIGALAPLIAIQPLVRFTQPLPELYPVVVVTELQ